MCLFYAMRCEKKETNKKIMQISELLTLSHTHALLCFTIYVSGWVQAAVGSQGDSLPAAAAGSGEDGLGSLP